MSPETSAKVYQLVLEMELMLDARVRPVPGEHEQRVSNPPAPASPPQPVVH